jgi:hypothetical protein
MKPIWDIVYWIQHSAIFYIWDPQENICKDVKNIICLLASFAGRRVVGFRCLSVDLVMELLNSIINDTLYLIDYITYGLHIRYTIQTLRELCR